MAVTSLLFFVSALAAALVFWRMPTKARLPWLLLISAAFLAAWNWQFVLILALFGLVNFWLGQQVERSLPTGKPTWKIIGIVFNVLILFVFKYNRFFLPSLLKLFGAQEQSTALQILLPIGLSFLVVQMISYLVDVANGRLKAERDLVKFGVYTLYFPKLLSGPVERARLFLPRLDAPAPFDRAVLNRSLSLIAIGLLRKLVFANPLFSLIPADAFTAPAQLRRSAPGALPAGLRLRPFQRFCRLHQQSCAASACGLALSSPTTSACLTSRAISPSSGAAGTSAFPTGCAITSSSPFRVN